MHVCRCWQHPVGDVECIPPPFPSHHATQKPKKQRTLNRCSLCSFIVSCSNLNVPITLLSSCDLRSFMMICAFLFYSILPSSAEGPQLQTLSFLYRCKQAALCCLPSYSKGPLASYLLDRATSFWRSLFWPPFFPTAPGV